VNDVETANVVLHSGKLMHEGAAHIVDFIDEVCAQRKVAAMVVNSVDAVVGCLLRASACEDVDFMTATIQSRRQLRDVDSDSTHGNTVQGFPRKQSDLHVLSP